MLQLQTTKPLGTRYRTHIHSHADRLHNQADFKPPLDLYRNRIDRKNKAPESNNLVLDEKQNKNIFSLFNYVQHFVIS